MELVLTMERQFLMGGFWLSQQLPAVCFFVLVISSLAVWSLTTSSATMRYTLEARHVVQEVRYMIKKLR